MVFHDLLNECCWCSRKKTPHNSSTPLAEVLENLFIGNSLWNVLLLKCQLVSSEMTLIASNKRIVQVKTE